jgi:hypothetical protein
VGRVPVAVAFFRNLNLGQGWAPTRSQLEEAFLAAGARAPDSVQVNAIATFHDGSGRGSNASVVLEQLTGVRVTSRALATVRRVGARIRARD